MKGTILDYTPAEAFILLDDDSIITIPTNSFAKLLPIGSNISLSNIYNTSNPAHSFSNKYNEQINL